MVVIKNVKVYNVYVKTIKIYPSILAAPKTRGKYPKMRGFS